MSPADATKPAKNTLSCWDKEKEEKKTISILRTSSTVLLLFFYNINAFLIQGIFIVKEKNAVSFFALSIVFDFFL